MNIWYQSVYICIHIFCVYMYTFIYEQGEIVRLLLDHAEIVKSQRTAKLPMYNEYRAKEYTAYISKLVYTHTYIYMCI